MRNIEDPGFEPRLLWPQTCALSVTLGASHSAPTVLPLRNPWEEWGEGDHEGGLPKTPRTL